MFIGRRAILMTPLNRKLVRSCYINYIKFFRSSYRYQLTERESVCTRIDILIWLLIILVRDSISFLMICGGMVVARTCRMPKP